MFYENLKRLCSQRGTTPTGVAKAIGISTSMTANWKKGGMPRGDTLQKLAVYFDVSVDYLLGKEDAVSNVEHIPGKDNRVTVVGRDGTVIQEELPDDKIELIKLIISQHQKEKK